MSVVIPVPDVARVDVRGAIDGKAVETSVFYRVLAPPITLSNLTTLVTRTRFDWQFSLIAQFGGDVVWNEFHGVDLTAGSSLELTLPHSFGISFQANTAPANIAIRLLPLGSSLPRPWQWGVRLFGVPVSKVTGDGLDHAWADAIKTLVRDRTTLMGAFGWRISVVQRVVGGVPLAVGVPYDVTDWRVATYEVAPMRRRLNNR